MLIIKTQYGNFGHPKDLMHYMEDESLSWLHVKVEYCFEEVFDKDMSFEDVSKWVSIFISPVASTLEDAVKWLRTGGV